MARDVHRQRKAGLGAIGDAAVQIFLWREGDRVQQEVEPALFLFDPRKQGFELAGLTYVARNDDRTLQRFRKRLHGPAFALR